MGVLVVGTGGFAMACVDVLESSGLESLAPRENVLINGIHQGAVEVEHEC